MQQIRSEESSKTFFGVFASMISNSLKPINPDESKIAYEAFRERHQAGIMIDVGAHFGGSLSQFANSGWQVYAFEPDPVNRKKLEESFGRYPNVIIDSRAVSNKIEKDVKFYTNEISTGISGLHPFHSAHKQTGTVDTITLDLFIDEHKITNVDFLKIDAEGLDLLVLYGFPWDKIKPGLIICEFEDLKTSNIGYSFHDMALFLQTKGYNIIVSEWFPIERYGGKHSWRRFAEYPCNINDSRAWGNLLAVNDLTIFKSLMTKCRRIERSGKLRNVSARLKRYLKFK